MGTHAVHPLKSGVLRPPVARFGHIYDLTGEKAASFKTLLAELKKGKVPPKDEFKLEREKITELTGESPEGKPYVVFPDAPEAGHVLIGISHPNMREADWAHELLAKIPGKNWDEEELAALQRAEAQGQGLKFTLEKARQKGQFSVLA